MKTTRWHVPCPVCKGHSSFDRVHQDGELLYSCKDVFCGHTWAMSASDDKGLILLKPLNCTKCGSGIKTKTHKIYTSTFIRKYLECTNSVCSHRYPLLVTFGRTLSPSALGYFNPDSGNTIMSQSADAKTSDTHT